METLAHRRRAGLRLSLNWCISRTHNRNASRKTGQQSLARSLGHFLMKDPTAYDTGNAKRRPGTQASRRASWDTENPQSILGHNEPAGHCGHWQTAGHSGTQNHRASWDTGKPRGILGHKQPQGTLGHRAAEHPGTQGKLKGVMGSSQ